MSAMVVSGKLSCCYPHSATLGKVFATLSSRSTRLADLTMEPHQSNPGPEEGSRDIHAVSTADIRHPMCLTQKVRNLS